MLQLFRISTELYSPSSSQGEGQLSHSTVSSEFEKTSEKCLFSNRLNRQECLNNAKRGAVPTSSILIILFCLYGTTVSGPLCLVFSDGLAGPASLPLLLLTPFFIPVVLFFFVRSPFSFSLPLSPVGFRWRVVVAFLLSLNKMRFSHKNKKIDDSTRNYE